MNKTINFTDEDIAIIEKHKEMVGVNSFSEAVRSFIRLEDKENKTDEISDDNFALLADAILDIDRKINELLMRLAPKSAGEIIASKKKVG